MTEQLQKDVFINEDLRYFQLTNIFFDRPLNEEDIITLKEVFFSINNISQIYFKDTFDLKGIEIVKSVLEISPTMEDALVEKYILNAFDYEYSNGIVEGINNVIKQIKHVACGYKKFKHLKARVMLIKGIYNPIKQN